ncbi:hypothetical protein AVEN_14487-1 [Araneus ventricosus]|uniref:Uncharacterized protein n=1 Tax=Araneus ventricosus TaxID=182803 RepID=A0A4Y2UW32_ARAVE|nr:hypothetical protein AVEN_14487-1 [Araneus ventricosus]
MAIIIFRPSPPLLRILNRWRHMPHPPNTPTVDKQEIFSLENELSELVNTLKGIKKIFSEILELIQMTQALKNAKNPSDKISALIQHLAQSVEIQAS